MTVAVTSALGVQDLKMYCFIFLFVWFGLFACFFVVVVLLFYNPGHLGRGNWGVEKSMGAFS